MAAGRRPNKHSRDEERINNIRRNQNQWRNQSPNETRAAAQLKITLYYVNFNLELALDLFGRSRWRFYLFASGKLTTILILLQF